MQGKSVRPDDIERAIREIDWVDVFEDAPDRADRSFRRKADDALYVFKAKPGFSDGKIKLPLAVVQGQKFDLQLNRLTQGVSAVGDFDRLPIPFRAVAADLETGEQVVLKSGSLPRALRASMAVPGAFNPVEMDGRLLVDGGIANNIPISVARELGAEVVIVSELGTDMLTRNEIESGIDVAAQMVNFLFVINSRQQLKTLAEDDVRISVELGDIGAGSFDRIREAVTRGFCPRAIADVISCATSVAASPAREAPTLLRGSGEVLTASRTPDFATWLRSAATPPSAPIVIGRRSPLAPASSAPISAPATGRMKVETASQAESR